MFCEFVGVHFIGFYILTNKKHKLITILHSWCIQQQQKATEKGEKGFTMSFFFSQLKRYHIGHISNVLIRNLVCTTF